MGYQRSAEEWRVICGGITGGYVPDTGKGDVYANGLLYVRKHLRPHGLPKPRTTVVDIGCGNGRLAMALVDDLIAYIGVEIVPQSVEFCQKAFAPWSNFSFLHLDVNNGHYYDRGKVKPENAVFPVQSEQADLVILSSVFTHLTPVRAVENYLGEIDRILKPGGELLTTWLRHPPNPLSQDEKRTVYAEMQIRDWLKPYDWVKDWGGTKPVRGDQWMILSQKPGAI